MRISDWSSDVCSSDLSAVLGDGERRGITGFVNGALLPGQVAMRVDAGYDNSGGYYKDAVSGQRLSARDTWFARAGLPAQMSGMMKAVPLPSFEVRHANTLPRNPAQSTTTTLILPTRSPVSP